LAIDIRTLILVTGIGHLMQVVVFYHQYKVNRELSGPGWWLAWSGIEVAGFSLLFLRNSPAFQNIAIALADPLITAGTLFIYVGLLKFFGRKTNIKILLIPYTLFVLIHLFYFFAIDSIFIRTVFFDIFISFIGFYTAFSLYQWKTPAVNKSANFNAILFLIHGIIFTYRTIAIINGHPFTEIFNPTMFNLVQFFDALIISLLWTFGFIIMLNQKLAAGITETKTHFEQIFNLSPDSVLITRMSDEIIVNCNENFVKTFGYSLQESRGKTSIALNWWKDPAAREIFFNITKEQGFCENFEAVFYNRNREEIHCLVSSKIISLNDSPHFVSVVRNITERKKSEEEIRSKNDELLKLNSEKEKFYSIIAHDLKSPFQGLIGYSEILSREYDTLSEEEKKEFIKSIEDLSHSSYRLLANLLEWTRIQTGQMVFSPEFFNLKVELHNTLNLLKHTAMNKNIEFHYDIDNLLFVTADKNMLSTIVRNIVSNAIKFTNLNGRIVLSTKRLNGFVEISISDTGIGIEKQVLEHLFRIDNNFSRKGTANEEGTGLGLILCKEMVEKHGGKIHVESEVGRGTTFSFTVPL